MLTCLVSLVPVAPAHADSLTLQWDPSLQIVSGYVVYVGLQPGSSPQRYDVGPSTAFTMENATPGQEYCFAVSAYLTPSIEGPRSSELCGSSDRFPTLANPGSQTSTVGQPLTLQLVGSDPDGRPVSYSATGLPPGLMLMPATGLISGIGTSAGVYPVSAAASDGVLSSSPQPFTWTMTAAPGDDRTPPSVRIANPTSSGAYATTVSAVALGGTAGDDTGVTQVTWVTDRGGNGNAVGTTNWAVASVGLQAGVNVITVRAHDAAGNQATAVLTITYTLPDSTAPTVSITVPTALTTHTATSAALAIGGTASDNRGVSRVSWVNSRGGAGNASGTTNWGVPLVALLGGTNVISVTAWDAAGNQGTDVLTVTYTPPDTSAPAVTIAGPTTASSYSTTSSVVTLGGTASDDRGVTAVTWSNDRGGSGFSSGTTNWSVPTVTLQSGANVITVTAQDGAGNRGTDVLTIAFNPAAPGPTPSFELRGTLYTSGSWTRVLLEWSAVAGTHVDIYRDGTRIGRTRNDRAHIDEPRTPGPFSYRLCVSGTSVCSNTAVAGR